MKYFARDPYPNCMGYQPGQWTTFGGESQVIGPIYNGPKEEGLVTLENMGALLDCGISEIGMDLASPLLFNSYIWSWLPNQPSGGGLCVAINANSSNLESFGRWATFECTTALPVACVSPVNNNSSTPAFMLLDWTIPASPISAPWSEASSICASAGLEFRIPLNPFSNRKLKDALLVVEATLPTPWVWLNQRST